MYLVVFFVAAVVITAKGQDSCGAQISEMRNCGVELFNQYHPDIHEIRNKTYMQIQQCFLDAGCMNPSKTVPEMVMMYIRYTLEWVRWFVPNWHYDLIMKMITIEYGHCLQKEIFEKVLFPRIEACVGEEFMIEDYELPKLSNEFVQKKMDMDMMKMRMKRSLEPMMPGPNSGEKSGYEKEMWDKAYREMTETLYILAATMKPGQMFNLEDPQMAQQLVWQVGEYACAYSNNSEASMASARSCIEGVAQEYWSNKDGTCKTPIARAFEARDKMYDYCMDKQECYSQVSEGCMEVFQYEPKILCECGLQLPLDKDYRMEVQEGIKTCLEIDESDIKENDGLGEVLYMTTIEFIEKVGAEFCQLKRNIPCKKAFGEDLYMTPTPDPNPNPDPPGPNPGGRPRGPRGALLDELKAELQAMKRSLGG